MKHAHEARGINRWLSRFRRRRGPIIRFWDAEFNLLYSEPHKVETWGTWLRRQANRVKPANSPRRASAEGALQQTSSYAVHT